MADRSCFFKLGSTERQQWNGLVGELTQPAYRWRCGENLKVLHLYVQTPPFHSGTKGDRKLLKDKILYQLEKALRHLTPSLGFIREEL